MQYVTNLKFEIPITKGRTKLLFRQLFVITLNKDDDSNIESCCVTSDARHPRVCKRKKRHMTENGLFVSFCLFWPGFGLSGPVMAFRACVWPFWRSIVPYYLRKRCHLCSVVELSTVFWTGFTREFAETVGFHRAGRGTYLVRLANHLADVHQLDDIQRRQYLQEAKLQPKVKVVVYESEADNSGKNHSTSTRNPVQTQETMYELSRSRRNDYAEASFKAKAKRTTTKNKTNRKKQRKSNSSLRGCRKIV